MARIREQLPGPSSQQGGSMRTFLAAASAAFILNTSPCSAHGYSMEVIFNFDDEQVSSLPAW